MVNPVSQGLEMFLPCFFVVLNALYVLKVMYSSSRVFEFYISINAICYIFDVEYYVPLME